MNALLAASAALLYAGAAAGTLRALRRATPILAAGALLLHALLLLRVAFAGGALTLGVSEALSAFAWQAALLLWAFCLIQPLAALGVAVYPLAALGAVAAAAWPTAATGIPLHDWKIQLHVILSLFSAGLLTLAAAQAIALAVQDRLLHRHPAGGRMSALPPLQTMERFLFQLISTGFFLLSLALVTGLLFVDDLLAQHLAHKTLLSVAAWLIFAGLLWGRWARGWRGRIAIRWALAGYAVLVLAYFGSKIVLEQILGRHWT